MVVEEKINNVNIEDVEYEKLVRLWEEKRRAYVTQESKVALLEKQLLEETALLDKSGNELEEIYNKLINYSYAKTGELELFPTSKK